MDTKKEAINIIKQMTIDEKIDMLSGDSIYTLSGNDKYGLPSFIASDGPHGVNVLKIQENGALEPSGNATCFPTACAAANSWNREVVYKIGRLIGEEAQLEGAGVSLGPAVNIKRHPLCGRNFEYYSEDPFLAGELGTAAVKGVQSQGMPACLKHFAANNQEYSRLTIDEIIDERTLREIYLSVFEKIVKEANPASLMCAYNSINGVFSSENKRLLTDILREEWGFEGVVISDWGAVHNRVAAVKAGLDLDMPGGFHFFDEQIKQALEDGTLTEEDIDKCVMRLIEFVLNIKAGKKEEGEIAKENHHKMAQDLASECMVLLENDGILPLKPGGKTAVIGALAQNNRYQGGGSSLVFNSMEDIPLEEIKKVQNITFGKGYDDTSTKSNKELEEEAVLLAKEAECVIYFMGLTYGYESEDYDRADLKLPQNQIILLKKIHQVNSNIVVVLSAGSAVETEWKKYAKGLLYISLAGEGSGKALTDILYGKVNPSGKLAETFPMYLENTPAYLFYPCNEGKAIYAEGLYVGYRYYDKKKIKPAYPFGYGLSYTEFYYDNLKINKKQINDTEELVVTCNVKNIGKVAGKEIVQLYVSDMLSTVDRPQKELKGFEKIELEPEETKTVTFILNKRSFAYYEPRMNDWHVESGEFEILVASSSEDIRLKEVIHVKSTTSIPNKYTSKTLVLELKNDPAAYNHVKEIMKNMPEPNLPGNANPIGPIGMDKNKQRDAMALGKLAAQEGPTPPFISEKELNKILENINEWQ